jgi:2-iminobutanoate/2-iminopropanoate deaminase
MHYPRLLPLLAPFAVIVGACAMARQDPAQTTSTSASATGAAQAGRGPGDIEFLGSSGALSQAVRVGNLLYMSGQLGTARDSAPGITPETRRAMEKIKATVERYGSSMDRVVKCTVFLVDMAEWGAMNAVYTTYFAADKRPARSAVGTSGLVGGGRVEIECIAVLP